MNDLDILERVTTTLDNINIPAKYVESIGIPISNCSNLLNALKKAVEDTIRRKQEEECAAAEAEPVEEPAVEFVEEFDEIPPEEPAEN